MRDSVKCLNALEEAEGYLRAAEDFEAKNSVLIDMVLEARGLERTAESIVGVLKEATERARVIGDAEHERIMDAIEAGQAH